MWYEGLEQRALLTAEHNGDGLTVTGTAGNDIIQIRTGKDETTGAAQIIVSESVRPAERGTKPAAPTVTRFDATKVKSVLVNAGAGDDAVALRGRRKTPFNLAATINGQDGNDRLTGGGGADAINGGLGNDRIEGGDGADVLHGDAGNDRVDGGRGADKLFGDDGNDFLLAADRGGVDTVDGGANDPVTTPTTTTDADGKKHRDRGNPGDVAVVDSADTVTTVEKSVVAKARKGGGDATTTTTKAAR
jgi:Ca2+-binding RTX toxin-like protein